MGYDTVTVRDRDWWELETIGCDVGFLDCYVGLDKEFIRDTLWQCDITFSGQNITFDK